MTANEKGKPNPVLPYDHTVQCVKCGYCLPSCPTYLTMGKETHSPRGRINLVRMASEGHIEPHEIQGALDMCLGCRACEPACPSDVQYGKILEGARYALFQNEHKKKNVFVRKLEDFIMQKFIPSSKMLNGVCSLIWFYQKSGLQKLAHQWELTKILPENLSSFEKVLPQMTSPFQRGRRPKIVPFSRTENKPKYKLAFFTGCIMDAVFEKINRISMELLAEAGCEVYVMEGQTCCGALHAHAGRMDDAKRLARRNIATFESLDIDFIVNNAGGCGAMLAEYDHLFPGDPEWEEKAKRFSKKSKDISQILAECELDLKHPVDEVVTYQPSCHMSNVQKVTKEPLLLMSRVPGMIIKEMNNAKMCCGSSGIYNIIHYKESMEVLDVKMKGALDTKATTIVTTNPGCLLQMKLGVEREGLSNQIRVIHLVELLAESAGLLTDPVKDDSYVKDLPGGSLGAL